MQALPLGVVREAFEASGEKRFPLARVFYPWLLGPDWRWAVLGFSFVKCLDDEVDESADADKSREVLSVLRARLDEVYRGRTPRDAAGLEGWGLRFAHWDASRGAPLRPRIEATLDSMAWDLERRGRLVPRAELSREHEQLGEAAIRYLGHFAARGRELPVGFVRSAAAAYLLSDTVLDLHHDLAFGIVNVPREEVERDRIGLAPGDPALARWRHDRGVEALGLFAEALARLRTLPAREMRLLARLYLLPKRRKVRRLLERGEPIEP